DFVTPFCRFKNSSTEIGKLSFSVFIERAIKLSTSSLNMVMDLIGVPILNFLYLMILS
ncbi:hypothetical protein LINPERHAP2_LOCUS10816, partial [Linum perenne]